MNNNNIYYNKYLKYKSKYLDLISLNNIKGGNIIMENKTEEQINDELKDYIKNITTGQQNCGVFSSKNSNIIYLCKSICCPQNYLCDIIEINNKVKLFPYIFGIIKVTDAQKYYIKMEKLSGDIFDLVFNKIPSDIIKNSDLPKDIIDEFEVIYKIRRKNNFSFEYNIDNRTIVNYKENKIPYKSYNKIMSNLKITYEIFDNLMRQILNKIEIELNKIIKIIVKKIYQLYTLSYKHTDLKLDNFGYNINADESYDIYFLDLESVTKINSNEKNDYLVKIFDMYKNKFKNYIELQGKFLDTFYYIDIIGKNINDDLYRYTNIVTNTTDYFLSNYLGYNDDARLITINNYYINYDNILCSVNSLDDFIDIIKKL